MSELPATQIQVKTSNLHPGRARATVKGLSDAVRFLENILNSSSSISIISTDLDGTIRYWNSGAENLFGYEAEEVVGRHKISLLYPGDSRETRDLVESVRSIVLGGKASTECEVREITKDGRTLWIRMTLTPQIDDRGRVTGILGIGEDITERRKAEAQAQELVRRLRQTLEGIIEAMVLTVEIRDPYTAGHQRAVADLAQAIARELGLPEEQVDGIHMAGVVHDLGKICIPAEILSKPGNLTEIQLDMIKTHPEVGFEILKNIEFPWAVAEIILQHHERIDGSGYPSGLVGDGILLEARVLAVADVVEAMASHRPYRASLGIDQALDEISRNRGTFYDSRVVDACLRLLREKGYELGSRGMVGVEPDPPS
ncbi:MAG: PAS domain S-box protein [Candidatus Eisenbacteria sp.]|nr:PAS domain S-box protein [Candidatus Eisenbacteria bacterium]